MSAFLGPVHVKMYDRILYQDAMAQAVLIMAEERGWADNLRNLADSKAPAASELPLEDIIDQSNIHGWLSDAAAGSERRLAIIVGGILAGHPERLKELQDVMRNFGQKKMIHAEHEAEQAFQAVHGILLDGMPCDFPFDVTESHADAVVWQVTNCPHTPYWRAEGYDTETYYLLRDAWMEGALEGSGIRHTRASGKHSLRKER